MAATAPKELDPQNIISKLIAELGKPKPWRPIHHQALATVKEGDANTLRFLTATNLGLAEKV